MKQQRKRNYFQENKNERMMDKTLIQFDIHNTAYERGPMQITVRLTQQIIPSHYNIP